MSNVLRLAIVDPNDKTRADLKGMLLGMDSIWLEAEASRYEFFSDVISQTHPDIAFVGLDSGPDKALELVAAISQQSPNTIVLVASSSTDGQLILRSMRAGAKEFLTYPLSLEDLVAALERISQQKFGGRDGRGRACTVVALAGATGGVGTTSLSVNLASAWAKDPRKSVVLVDLDLALGDADVFLDMIPDYTLVDVAQNITRLDFTLLKRSLTKHSSGLYLLPRPVHMDDAMHISTEDLQRVIGLLKATFTHLVIDLSKSYNRLDRVALEMADHVLMITQLDLPCLRNVVRLMMSFNEMDGVTDKVKVITNRQAIEDAQIGLKKAEDTIGRKIFCQIPNDYRTMISVRNNGVPLVEQAPKAKVTQAIVQLAAQLNGEETVPTEDVTAKSSLTKLLGALTKKTAPAPAANSE